MGAMARAATESEARLALLLAGARAPLRRAVAAVGSATAVLSQRWPATVPREQRRRARELLDDGLGPWLGQLAASGWRWLVPADGELPPLLWELADPPLGLFVRGRLATTPAVALVGSRRATPYGRQVARLLGAELARAGAAVVSGMARGVDAAAHEGALEGGGTTWAVWGTGPDRVYPREHRPLAERIAAAGALLTEYPPGVPPRRHQFPERNRIIAGLAAAVVVVEAAARSGALITARLALDEGREVLAVPGSVLSELSVGPNALLRLGARPALTPRDVLEAVGLSPAPAQATAPAGALLEAIPAGVAVSVDQLAVALERPVAAVLAELLELELAGRVERTAAGEYARRG